MSEAQHVLVVDDDESIRDFVHTALVDDGYEVTEAPDGAAALALVALRRPDVILLDMLMPVMDGWAFARAYRQTAGPHAPIIVVSAARDTATRAADINAAGILAKPFRLEALFDCVRHVAAKH